MKKNLITLMLLVSVVTLSCAQNELYINDVYFDRFFRKVIIEAPGSWWIIKTENACNGVLWKRKEAQLR